MTYCLKPMKARSTGQFCGRRTGHKGKCLSEEAHANKRAKANLATGTYGAHRLKVPPEFLPDALMRAMASYSLSGLVMPGDTTFPKIVARLAVR